MLPLLQVKNLSVDFISHAGITHALRNIFFSVNRNEVLALVGESGSGKSVTALSILQLLPSPPAKYLSGEILFSENNNLSIDLLQKKGNNLKDIRGYLRRTSS